MFIKDWRDIANGNIIPTESGGYCDQPSLTVLPDGSWLCSVTTSNGAEGSSTQYISVMRSRDKGKSWSAPKRLEPPENGRYWESSYSKLITGPDGTVFCLYCYNDRHITASEAGFPRIDMGISFCFRYSRDCGESWSERKKIPIRDTLLDRTMPHISPGGEKIPLYWNVARVLIKDGSVYVPLTKIGNRDGFMSHGEGLLLKSDNLLSDPENASWTTLPEGDAGITGIDGFDTVCEEHCYAFLPDGGAICTFRTANGGAGCAVSRDSARSFAPSARLRYPDGRAVKNTRANNTFWDIGGGRYLYWFTNCGHRGYYPRNPAWICAAVVREGELLLSQPEIVLYTTTPGTGFSYPDIIVEQERLYISETQKSTARIHEIPMSFIDSIFRQFDPEAQPDIVPDAELFPGKNAVEPIDTVYREFEFRPDHVTPGLTFSLSLDFSGAQTILDWRDEKGCGVVLRTDPEGRIEAELSETRETVFVRTERCLAPGANRVSVVFDFVAGAAYFVVNGLLLDGGDELDCGWRLISRGLSGLGLSRTANVSGAGHIRLYRRALTVTECILEQRSL